MATINLAVNEIKSSSSGVTGTVSDLANIDLSFLDIDAYGHLDVGYETGNEGPVTNVKILVQTNGIGTMRVYLFDGSSWRYVDISFSTPNTQRVAEFSITNSTYMNILESQFAVTTNFGVDRIYAEVTYTLTSGWQGTVNNIKDPTNINGVDNDDINTVNNVTDSDVMP